jgi:hypothetical protein
MAKKIPRQTKKNARYSAPKPKKVPCPCPKLEELLAHLKAKYEHLGKECLAPAYELLEEAIKESETRPDNGFWFSGENGVDSSTHLLNAHNQALAITEDIKAIRAEIKRLAKPNTWE